MSNTFPITQIYNHEEEGGNNKMAEQKGTADVSVTFVEPVGGSAGRTGASE